MGIEYAARLQARNGFYDVSDLSAAGFSPSAIMEYEAAAARPAGSMTPVGDGSIVSPNVLQRRERHANALAQFFGGDNYDRNDLRRAQSFTGTTDPSATFADSVGLADITPMAALYGFEEGADTAARGYRAGDYLTTGLGVGEMALGAAEAVPGLGLLAKVGRRAVAPVAVAGRAGLPGAQAVQEASIGALPAPRSASEAMARDVLDLRAAGREAEVTEEMMAAADDTYMYFNTPLPMDVASRNARADAMFPMPGFHGTNFDIDGFRGPVYSSDNPTLASTYAEGITDAQVYPLRLGSTQGDEVINARGRSWDNLPDYLVHTDAPSIYDDIDFGATRSLPSMAATDDIAQAAKTAGRSGVQFNNIYDLGRGFTDRPFSNVGYSPEQANALNMQYIQELSAPSNVDVRLDPSLVRSSFARFDPAFAHLRNLSAGFGGLGLLGLASGSQPAQGDGT
jgi:hypothetical protein